jgi:hypothetical protein
MLGDSLRSTDNERPVKSPRLAHGLRVHELNRATRKCVRADRSPYAEVG